MSASHRLDCLLPIGGIRGQGLLPVPHERERRNRFSNDKSGNGIFLSFVGTLAPREETTATEVMNHSSSIQ